MRSRAECATRDLVATALLLTVGACLGYAEATMLPSLPVPGVRLGLANVAVVLALAILGPQGALTVSVGRALLVSLATGSLGSPASVMSLSGATAAWVAMAALSRAGRTFSPIGWSLGGSAAHVSAQLCAACLLTGSIAPLAFLPLSLGASVPTGLVVGHAARLLISRMPVKGLAFGR